MAKIYPNQLDPATKSDAERTLYAALRDQLDDDPVLLLDDVFDYSLPPKIRFDGPLVEYVDGQPVEFGEAMFRLRQLAPGSK